MRVRRLLAVGFLVSLLLSIYGCGSANTGGAEPPSNMLVAYSTVSSLIIEADFPPMQVNQQIDVEVAIYPTGGPMTAGDVRTLEKATAIVTGATPVGTPGNMLVNAFGPYHSVSATATLETSPSIFTTVPTGPQLKPLDRDKVVWNWFVTPLEAGEQVIGVDIEVQWTSTLNGKQSLPYTLGFPKFPVNVHAAPLPTPTPTPTPPPSPPDWGAIATVLGSLIGGTAVIIAAWIGTSHFGRWLKNRSHRTRNRPPTIQNTTETNTAFNKPAQDTPVIEGEQHTSPDDDLMTVDEVARHLRVDPTTVRRWIKNGSLSAITLPGRGKSESYRVKKSAIRVYDKDVK